MSELRSRTLKRFIVCFRKKEADNEFKKHVLIEAYVNETDAITKICNRFSIPIQKIGQEDYNKEGYIYCNTVYNPKDEEENDG